MKRKISVPCYVRNGGVNNIVNIPMGVFMRHELKTLISELLSSSTTLTTFCAANITPRRVTLLKGLDAILSLNLKPKASRKSAVTLLAENEENLNNLQRVQSNDEAVNLVSLSVSCGLIVLLFMLASHLEYLSLN